MPNRLTDILSNIVVQFSTASSLFLRNEEERSVSEFLRLSIFITKLPGQLEFQKISILVAGVKTLSIGGSARGQSSVISQNSVRQFDIKKKYSII